MALERTASNGRDGTELERIIAELWQDSLGLDAVGLQVNLFDLGANSLSVADVATSLKQRLKREIPLTDLFAYPTIAALAAHLSGQWPERKLDRKPGSRRSAATSYCSDDRGRRSSLLRRGPGPNEGTGKHWSQAPSIAVVGMAGRFPGARNLSEFWRNLRDGVESISIPQR